MTSAPRRALGAGAAIIAALVLVAVLVLAAGPSRHPDGAGELASLNGPGNETMAVNPNAGSGATSWTYGLRLCLAKGDAPATIKAVTPTAAIGTGFRVLGILVREFTPSDRHTTIIGVEGFPPPRTQVPDPTSDAIGFQVTTPCSNGPTEPYTELLVGLGLHGTDGGGWRGLDIAYIVAGRDRVLSLDHDLLICGPAVPEFCHGGGPAESP